MKNISTAFRQKLYNNERDYVNSARITLSDGTVLNVDNLKIMNNGLQTENAVSDDDEFTALGSTIINAATLILYNNDDVYSDYDFINAKVELFTGLNIPAIVNDVETTVLEQLQLGTYTVDDATYGNATITLFVLDYMEQFDRPYSQSNLTYPTTLYNIIAEACQTCGVTLASDSIQFPHYNYTVPLGTLDKESCTYREVIGYVATIAGCFATVDVEGKLSLRWFNTAALENNENDLDGGTFDPWTTGNIVDGGSFNPWTTGNTIDGGDFIERRPVHYINKLRTQNIGVDDVVITGIRFSYDNEDDTVNQDRISHLVGTEGYVIEVEDNPFINETNWQEISAWLSTKLIGLRFRKCNVSHLSDPSIEAGDVGFVWDTKGAEHPILITRVTFSPVNPQEVVCGASTPSRNSASRFSTQTKNYVASRKKLKEQKDTFDLAIENLQNRMDNVSGLFETRIQQQDGSYITYLHNKPHADPTSFNFPSESDIVIAISSVGVTVTSTGNTANPVWYGLQVDGQFLASIIQTISLFFDYASGGTLTLGGANNVNGTLRILDASGTQIGGWDNTGINAIGNLVLAGELSKAQIGQLWTVAYDTFNGFIGIEAENFQFHLTDSNNKITDLFSLVYNNWPSNKGLQQSISTTRGYFYEVYGIADIGGSVSSAFSANKMFPILKRYSINSDKTQFYMQGGKSGKDFRFDLAYDHINIMSESSVNAPNGPFIRAYSGYIQISTDAGVISSSSTPSYKSSKTANIAANVNGFIVQGGSNYLLVTASAHRIGNNTIAFDSSSSKRYKHDIKELGEELAAEKLYELRVIQFVYNDDATLQYDDMRGKTLPGFIAEEVDEIYPSAVIHDSEGGVESWDERRIIPGMLSLIQKQKKQLDEQEQRIKNLEERLAKLEKLML